MARPSIKSYLVQSVWQWCEDVGNSTFIMVDVNDDCTVPMAYVQNDRIVLDISSEATGRLDFQEQEVVFEARFGDEAMRCVVPYANIFAVYPMEEPEKGMMLPAEMNEPVDEEEPEAPKPSAPVFSRVK